MINRHATLSGLNDAAAFGADAAALALAGMIAVVATATVVKTG